MSLLLAELAEGLGGAGQIAEGLAVIDKALARAERTEERWFFSELLRKKGELLLLQGALGAEECFGQAFDRARRLRVGQAGPSIWSMASSPSCLPLSLPSSSAFPLYPPDCGDFDPLVRRAVAFLLAPPGVALLRASAYDLALASGVSRGTP